MIEILLYAWPLWLSNIALNALGLGPIRKHDRVISERVFGGSATWGGVALSIILGVSLWILFPSHELIFWKAIAACLGHMIASFLKRRLGIGRGEYVLFLAHGDYVIAFAMISAIIGPFNLALSFKTYIVTVLITPLVTYLSHRVKLRKDPL